MILNTIVVAVASVAVAVVVMLLLFLLVVVVMVVVVSGADQPGMSVGGDYPGLTEDSEVQQCLCEGCSAGGGGGIGQ